MRKFAPVPTEPPRRPRGPPAEARRQSVSVAAAAKTVVERDAMGFVKLPPRQEKELKEIDHIAKKLKERNKKLQEQLMELMEQGLRGASSRRLLAPLALEPRHLGVAHVERQLEVHVARWKLLAAQPLGRGGGFVPRGVAGGRRRLARLGLRGKTSMQWVNAVTYCFENEAASGQAEKSWPTRSQGASGGGGEG